LVTPLDGALTASVATATLRAINAPNAYDILVTSAAFNAAQLLTTLLFRRRLRRELAAPPPAYAPSVTVVVACKGEGEGFAANIESLLDQDYAGEREYLLATPSREDPAHRALEALLRRRGGGDRARLHASEAVPSRSSGKALDLVTALAEAPPRSEVLLFADADIRVHRSWLAELVDPLGDPRVGAATSVAVAVPRRLGAWSVLRFLWLGMSVCCWSFMRAVCGQSLAMRRADFLALGVPALWERALLEDLALSARLRAWDKEVRFVARAMPVTDADCDARQFFDVFNRWIKCCRLFDPGVWLLSLGYLGAKTGLTLWCLARAEWRLLAFFWAFDMLNQALLALTYLRGLPGRFAALPLAARAALPALAAAASPLLTLVYLVNFMASLLDNRVSWGSYVYRVGPDRSLTVARR
jgi:hypothetical protein